MKMKSNSILALLLILLCLNGVQADVEGLSAPTVEGLTSPTVEGITHGCAQGADSSDLCAGGTTGVNLAGSDARGFCFTKSSTETVWGIDIYLWANDGVGDSVTLRIGTSSNLSTYLAESSSTNITNTSGQLVTIDFGQCLELTNATVYCVGMTETGTVLMGRSSSNVCGSDSDDAYTYASGSTGWDMVNSETTQDIQWTLVLDD